jgi:2-methylcitrate dehydratase PrpD
MAGAHRIERLAEWAAGLTVDDVPPRVLETARAQRRAVLAGVAASASDAASQRVAAGTPDPLTRAVARSIALDFDDYLCFAHTGHSAVLVALAEGARAGADGTDQLLAQVAANEVAGRLGGACLLGPLNGQLWSFVHAAGAAVAAGRLLGLDARRLAHALALALWQAPHPTVPGFMAPDSKLLTAAEPAGMGVRAAALAACGVTGPLDLLDHPDGFLAVFAAAPLPGMLEGLGEAWATDTLSIKPYPGCAYVDTTVDALGQLGALDPDAVASITVDAGILTCGMDALSSRYGGLARPPTPVTVTFSIPWTVAVAVVAGRLTPYEVNEEWLAKHADQLRDVASRVRLRHDPALTERTGRAFAGLVPLAAVARDAGAAGLARAARLNRRHAPTVAGPRAAARDLVRLVTGLPRLAREARSLPRRYWDPEATVSFVMTFPARVTVRTRDGAELTAEADTPRGGAGNAVAGPDAVSRERAATWLPDGTVEAIARDDPRLWDAVVAMVGGG